MSPDEPIGPAPPITWTTAMKAFLEPTRPMGRLPYALIHLGLALAICTIDAVDTVEVRKAIVDFGGLPSLVVTVAFIQVLWLASQTVFLFALLRRASDLDWTWRSKALVIALVLFINFTRASLPNINVDAFFDASAPASSSPFSSPSRRSL